MTTDPRLVRGRRLANALPWHDHDVPLIAAATAGGLVVARGVSDETGWPIAFTPALPLYPPWSASFAYGAVAFDHSLAIDEFLVEALELTGAEIRAAVGERVAELAKLTAPSLESRRGGPVVLADDGTAPLQVLRASLIALRNAGAGTLAVAIAGHCPINVRKLMSSADAVLHVAAERELERFQ